MRWEPWLHRGADGKISGMDAEGHFIEGASDGMGAWMAVASVRANRAGPT